MVGLACGRNNVSMYMKSDAVVEIVVKKSRKRSKGAVTRHLVAKYKVLDVFKGDLDKGEILIVTNTCLDKLVLEERKGYPVVENYCRGLIGTSLTGVDSRDGKPVMKSISEPNWILFIKKDIKKGAPQLTWVEVTETSYYGVCWQTRNDIPPDQREGFDRLKSKLGAIKLMKTGDNLKRFYNIEAMWPRGGG